MAHVTDSLAHIIATEAALLESVSETIGAVHYERLVERDTQMTGNKYVKARDNQDHNLKWKSDVLLSDSFAE